jgi:MFS transporter, PAT family, beta-lactamase induction signal transducer AmpG
VSTEAAAAAAPSTPTRAPGFARRMRWVAVLYFAQGFPFGVFREVWGVFFRLFGVSLTQIGLMELLGLPWIAKPLWAPLVDRYGDRRHWISGCLVVLATTMALHTVFDAAHPGVFVWSVLLLFTLASATQDIAIDAHTIAFLEKGEEGAANGLRVTFYRLAVIFVGGVLVFLAGYVGWSPTFWIGAALLLVLAIVVLKAPPAELRASERKRFWRPLYEWLSRPGSIPTLVFVLLYKLGDQAISPMIKPFWVDRKISVQTIAAISTTFGVGATIVGALLGGFLTTKWGLIRGLVVMGIFQLLSNLGYAVVALLILPKQAIYAAGIFESFTQGLGTAAFLSLLMRLCDKEHAATQYALLSALFSLVRHVAGAASGWATQSLGYGSFFLYTVFLAFPAFALLPWVKRRIAVAAR